MKYKCPYCKEIVIIQIVHGVKVYFDKKGKEHYCVKSDTQEVMDEIFTE